MQNGKRTGRAFERDRGGGRSGWAECGGGACAAAIFVERSFLASGSDCHGGAHDPAREEEITVTLPDGKNAAATLAGTDPGTDLAVLKVDGSTQGPGRTG